MSAAPGLLVSAGSGWPGGGDWPALPRTVQETNFPALALHRLQLDRLTALHWISAIVSKFSVVVQASNLAAMLTWVVDLCLKRSASHALFSQPLPLHLRNRDQTLLALHVGCA